MTSEAYGKLICVINTDILRNVNMVEITLDNVRYWQHQIKKQEYQRSDDPWVSAVTFVEEQTNVVVHSYIY